MDINENSKKAITCYTIFTNLIVKVLKKSFLFSFIFTLTINLSFSQQLTVNFTTPFVGYSIYKKGNDIFLGSQGGVEKLNTVNGQKTFYTAGNTPMILNETHAIFVDNSNNYWFGNFGLVKFDGNQWNRYYDLPSGDTIKFVQRIIQDSQGKIHCRDGSRAIFTFDSNAVSVFYATQLGINIFSDFDVDTSGVFWFSGNDYLWKYDGITTTILDNTWFGFSVDYTKNVRADKKGNIWITLKKNGSSTIDFYKYDGNSLTQIVDSTLNRATLRNLYIGEDGQKYFYGINDTVFCYNDSTWSIFTYSKGQLASKHVYDIHVDSLGGIYSCDGFESLIRKYDGIDTTDYDAHGYNFFSNYFKDIFVGDNGYIYTCNDTQIVITNGINFQTIGKPSIMNNLQSIKQDKFGNIWAITSSGTIPYLAKYNGSSWTTYNISAYGATTWSLEVTPNGTVYIGMGDGLLKFDGTMFTKFVLNDPYSSQNPRSVYTMCSDSANNIWLPDYYSMVKFDGSAYSFFRNYPSVVYKLADAILCDKQGNIWFSNIINVNTYEIELMKFDGTNYIAYNDSNSLFPRNWGVWDLYEDDSGKIYIGTSKGMIVFDGQQFTLYNYMNYGFGNNGIGGIVKDNNDNIWFTAVNVLGIFNPSGITNIEIEPKNSISGNVFFDQNQDGIKDSSDTGLPSQILMMTPDSIFRITNNTGDYMFYSDTGTVKVENIIHQGWNLTSDSTSFSIQVDSLTECCYDFGIYPDTIIHDVAFNMTNSNARCNRTIPVWINFYNSGTLPENVIVYYKTDSLTNFYSSSPDTSYSSSDTLFWLFSQIAPFELKQITVYIQMPADTFAGSPIVFTSGILDSATNQLYLSDQITDTLRCAFDPNNKTVSPPGIRASHYTLFTDTLVYTIHFQNTGNDTARTVSLYDTLNSAFDISSFKFISASHPFDVNYDSKGRLRFKAENIMLPDSGTDQLHSQGYVKYSVRAKSGLPDPTPVTNTAYIYFDFNYPVITNTTLNTLVNYLNMTVSESPRSEALKVFPNPSSDFYRFIYKIPIDEKVDLRIFDNYGKVVAVFSLLPNTNSIIINLESFTNGVYYYTLNSSSGLIGNGKLILIK